MERADKTSTTGGGITIDSSEEEDQEERYFDKKTSFEDDLASFREKWQKELLLTPKHIQSDLTGNPDQDQIEDCETKAKILFTTGIEMEKNGKLYEAIQFYRRAVQIVPDIEFKLDNAAKPKLRDRHAKEYSEKDLSVTESPDQVDTSDDSDGEIKDGELLLHIQKKIAKGSPLCTPKFEQTATHIGQVPVEIVLFILRWVVSADLDLRALEMFSGVCRGFYLCGRDPEIWRLACLRVWGLNCGPNSGIYDSWRDMFIERPRLLFNGCYISKTTYIRPGENSFQDHLYRPWHLVAYYRFLRFFPEGTVLMLTTADEPAQCVGMMKNRNARYPVLSGYYRLKDDKVTVMVQKQDKKISYQGFKRSRRRDTQEGSDQTFHMELQISNYNRKRHVQLMCTHYSVFTKSRKGDESTCNFDVRANRFPPLWFSRVKSFTAESEDPLS